MSFAETLAADRRIAILLTLSEMDDRRLNEAVLRSALDALGHLVSRELLRADLSYLAEHGLAAKEVLKLTTGEMWVMRLTAAGEDVSRGKLHPGIARAPAR